jgi:hypothetical protein
MSRQRRKGLNRFIEDWLRDFAESSGQQRIVSGARVFVVGLWEVGGYA